MTRKVTDRLFTDREYAVLTILEQRHNELTDKLTSEISELAQKVGTKDTDEVLRALYTLEGKHMVSPEPKGDFTSNKWVITERGLKALQYIRDENSQ